MIFYIYRYLSICKRNQKIIGFITKSWAKKDKIDN